MLTNVSFSVTTVSLRGVDLVKKRSCVRVVGGLIGCLRQASRASPLRSLRATSTLYIPQLRLLPTPSCDIMEVVF